MFRTDKNSLWRDILESKYGPWKSLDSIKEIGHNLYGEKI